MNIWHGKNDFLGDRGEESWRRVAENKAFVICHNVTEQMRRDDINRINIVIELYGFHQ